jgi:hypothetical protein
MVFYVGGRFTTEVSGSRWKRTRCEGCGNEYVYLMSRNGKGSGSSPYFLDNVGAQSESRMSAAEDLSSSLSHDFDIVACPDCGLYQSYMLRRLKWRTWSWALVLGLCMVGASLIIAAARPADPPWSLVSALGAGVIGAGFIVLYWRGCRTIGPKGRAPGTYKIPKGPGGLPTRVGTVLRGADYDAMRRESAARKKHPGKVSPCPKCRKPVLYGAPVCRWCGISLPVAVAAPPDPSP